MIRALKSLWSKTAKRKRCNFLFKARAISEIKKNELKLSKYMFVISLPVNRFRTKVVWFTVRTMIRHQQQIIKIWFT